MREKVIITVGILSAVFFVGMVLLAIYRASIKLSSAPASSSASAPVSPAGIPPAIPPQQSPFTIMEPLTWAEANGVYYLTGLLRNDSGRTVSVMVSFTLYDRTGAQVGSTFDTASDWRPGICWRYKAPVLDDTADTAEMGKFTVLSE